LRPRAGAAGTTLRWLGARAFARGAAALDHGRAGQGGLDGLEGVRAVDGLSIQVLDLDTADVHGLVKLRLKDEDRKAIKLLRMI
jgi:hypothetical protein